jgi:hypothetical protein
MSPKKILILLSLLLIFVAIEYPKNNNNDKITQSLEERKRIAAIKGVDWFIKRKDKLPTYDNIVYFTYFYKTTSDPLLAQKYLSLVDEKISKINSSDYIENSNNGIWDIFKTIYLKQCQNKDYKIDLDRLKGSYDKDNDKLQQKLVLAYLLEKVGLEKNAYSNVISEIRSKKISSSNKDYYLYLYALTHIIYTKSGYYNHYLNSKDYKLEIEEFNNAIDLFLSKKDTSDAYIDIVSEVLISLKILQIEKDNRVNRLYERLIKAQHPDGSFGKDESIPNGISHHTLVATIALMPFPKEFRNIKNTCSLY